jgi:hypothetical protein
VWDVDKATSLFLAAFRGRVSEADRFAGLVASLLMPPSQARVRTLLDAQAALKCTAMQATNAAMRELAAAGTISTVARVRECRRMLRVRGPLSPVDDLL